MKRNTFAFSITLLLAVSTFALAQSTGGEFTIVKSTIDNGGGTSSGGEFSISGTIGQSDATDRVSVGGEYLLSGGFWAVINDVLFKNGFEDN